MTIITVLLSIVIVLQFLLIISKKLAVHHVTYVNLYKKIDSDVYAYGLNEYVDPAKAKESQRCPKDYTWVAAVPSRKWSSY